MARKYGLGGGGKTFKQPRTGSKSPYDSTRTGNKAKRRLKTPDAQRGVVKAKR